MNAVLQCLTCLPTFAADLQSLPLLADIPENSFYRAVRFCVLYSYSR